MAKASKVNPTQAKVQAYSAFFFSSLQNMWYRGRNPNAGEISFSADQGWDFKVLKKSFLAPRNPNSDLQTLHILAAKKFGSRMAKCNEKSKTKNVSDMMDNAKALYDFIKQKDGEVQKGYNWSSQSPV